MRASVPSFGTAPHDQAAGRRSRRNRLERLRRACLGMSREARARMVRTRMVRAMRSAALLPVVTALVGVPALSPVHAEAEEAPHLAIELNKLETVGEGPACRVYLVFQNTTPQDFEKLRLDLVVFGTDGVVAKRLSVDAAPLPASK